MKAISSLIAASSVLVSLPFELNTSANALTLSKSWWGFSASRSKVSLLSNDFLAQKQRRLLLKTSSPRNQQEIYDFIDTIVKRKENQEAWKSRVDPGDYYLPNLVNQGKAGEFSLNGNKSAHGDDEEIGFRMLSEGYARIKVGYFGYRMEDVDQEDVDVLQPAITVGKNSFYCYYKEEAGEILANDVYDIEWVQGPRVHNTLDGYAYTVIFHQKDKVNDVLKLETTSYEKTIWEKIFRFWAGLKQHQDDFHDWLVVTYPAGDCRDLMNVVPGYSVKANHKEIKNFVSSESERIKFFIPSKDKLILFRSTTPNKYTEKRELLAEIYAKDVTSVDWIDINLESRYDVSFTMKDGKSHQIVFQCPTSLKEEWDRIFRMWAPDAYSVFNPIQTKAILTERAQI